MENCFWGLKQYAVLFDDGNDGDNGGDDDVDDGGDGEDDQGNSKRAGESTCHSLVCFIK